MTLAEVLAAAFAAIAFGLIVWLVKNDADWMDRFLRVSEERNNLLMKPVIEADMKRREAQRAAGIPAPDYVLTHAGAEPPMWASTETTTYKPRKRRHYRQVVY